MAELLDVVLKRERDAMGRGRQLGHLVVDLTPMLAGGANGGAKKLATTLTIGLIEEMPCIPVTIIVRSLDALDNKKFRKTIANSSRASVVTNYNWTANVRLLAKSLIAYLKGKKTVVFSPFGPTHIKTFHLPIVTILYDMQFKRYKEFFSTAEIDERQKNFDRIVRESKSVIAISEFAKREAIHYGCPNDKLRAIPIEVNRRLMTNHKDDEKFLCSNQLKKQGYLLYPANFWGHKNHALLLVAFRLACAQGLDPGIKLVLTGQATTTGYNLAEELINRYKLEKRVIIIGYISDEEMRTLYLNACALVYPSLYEGFGIPLVEAMLANIPVCCANIEAINEVAGNAGLKFDPRSPKEIAKAMITITSDENARSSLLKSAKAQLSLYTDESRMIMRYLDVLENS